MIVLHETIPATTAERRPRPVLWGLDAAALHDAHWRAHGVQCIRRGRPEPLQGGRDLFLLLEPDQLVLFDVGALAERLVWRRAAVTRVRIVDQEKEPYSEQVEIDDEGLVRQVARRYRAQTHEAYRVLLTRRARLARIWTEAGSRRSAWRQIRGIAGLSNVDGWRAPGGCYAVGRRSDEVRLVDRLVETWPTPDRSIEGIEEIGRGVWAARGQALERSAVAVGPAWIGEHGETARRGHVIGPMWIADRTREIDGNGGETARPVRVRDIAEIDPGDAGARAARPVRRRPIYGIAKRGLDIVAAATGLAVLGPLLLVIVVAIVLDDGWPVVYGHRRQARGGRAFRCWKFRTMCRDAERIKQRLREENVCDGPQFYMKKDPRVTRTGEVLRRYHLDELPQLWNVLVGQMSLVGPRPSPDSENRISPAWREIRLSVRPGITGLWQVKRTRRPGVDFQEWIRYDVEYVERADLWLDLRILYETIRSITGRDASHAPDQER